MSFELIHKPKFTNQLLAIPKEHIPHILEKIELLREDPRPHGDVKKKLHGYKGDVYRLRSGNYRIIYHYGDGWVCLLGVDDRKDVYKGDQLVAEEPAVPVKDIADPELLLEPQVPPTFVERKAGAKALPEDTPLPVPLDEALLIQLRIPVGYITNLKGCRTLNEFLAINVPGPIRERIWDAVTAPDIDQAIGQPSYVTGDVSNLLRFTEGELIGFLLKLSPEQQRYVTWRLDATGPTLLKGGPGSGKSTVALYRAKEVLQALRNAGQARPRVLFTTYTTALVAFSQQLLKTLLGEDEAYVDVRTADNLAVLIGGSEASTDLRLANAPELRESMKQAIDAAVFEGSTQAQQSQLQAVRSLNLDYLIEEITDVIQARQITTREGYLSAPRPGRVRPLSTLQRIAIWQVSVAFEEQLVKKGLQTWQQVRARAEETMRRGHGPRPYDAVIVDEAQDLNPSVLRMLVQLCREPNRLFITADANQSIYGAGFRWADVHQDLKFQGRTGVLQANYRSTREIGEAAHSYLKGELLDREQIERIYVNSGPHPILRTVPGSAEEAQLLARFFTASAQYFRLGIGSCALLCPTQKAGQALAASLSTLGLPARFMAGKDLDLSRNEIKVLTLKACKGLEFPIVALAGFPSKNYPVARNALPAEEWTEWLARERRTLFVAMTRAMRALLVVVLEGADSPLFTGFESAYWNLG